MSRVTDNVSVLWKSKRTIDASQLHDNGPKPGLMGGLKKLERTRLRRDTYHRTSANSLPQSDNDHRAQSRSNTERS